MSQRIQCKQYIEEYGKWIVDAIISGAAPKWICMGMGLCTPWEHHVSQPPFAVVSNRFKIIII